MPKTPWDDDARPILDADKSLTDAEREKVWDIYHESQTVSILARRLADLGVEPALGQQLCRAKAVTIHEPTDTEKVHAIMQHMSAMDRRVLDAAEKHPNVLRALLAGRDE